MWARGKGKGTGEGKGKASECGGWVWLRGLRWWILRGRRWKEKGWTGKLNGFSQLVGGIGRDVVAVWDSVSALLRLWC